MSVNDSLQILNQDQGHQLFDEPDLEWDHERPLAGPSDVPQDVRITPNVETRHRVVSTPTASRGPRPRKSGSGETRHSGLPTRDLHQWLEVS